MHQIARDDVKSLRQFGLGFAALIWLFFFLLLPWWFGYERHPWPHLVGGGIAALALLQARWIYPLFAGWMQIARPLAWLNTRLILGLVFFLLLLPLGGWLFWRGKLHFKVGFDAAAPSYKVRRSGFDPKQMEHPF
ncbi:MAG: hypothetical protein KA754_10925 [Corallincola sp.]|nr:hypothetical protein [Corallincola sp.]